MHGSGAADHDQARHSDDPSRQRSLIAAIAAGGVLGAEARYGLSLAIGSSDRQFPWSTLLVNLSGCLLIGALMVLLLELPAPHRLARPFLGVGVLGGYTTYSGFAVEVQRLLLHHRPLVALSYVGATMLGCAAAVWLSSAVAGRLLRLARRRRGLRPADLP